MPRLIWGVPGERFYETGLDRGVLYLESTTVAWSGLISVTESPSGGDPRSYYIDGVKVNNLSAAEEFEATINAFSSPPEFAPCDGTMSIQNGLFATQQPRKSFGLSYRTKVGNDVDGSGYGYKIHLVYNALAAPTQRENKTEGQSSDPTAFSWAITTLPPNSYWGIRPTGHFVIDSRLTPTDILATVEDTLYGTDIAAATLPTVSDLVAMFS